MIGRTIGTYTITGTIGSSGMGEVFVGEDVMLERQVALKHLRPALAGRPDVVERFRLEAVILGQLQHTNIATVYAFLQEGADFFLVMEYVKGWTLQHVLHVWGALAPGVAGALFQQALDGIGFAHRHHIIHRDLKPANMMLTDGGVIKVMDFGLARVVGSAHVTRQGHLVGTLAYSAPEHIRGEETDARSDVYSLGVLLYELVTGRLPFASDNAYTLMRAHVEVQPPSPRQSTPAVSAALEHVILRALSKAPTERFQSTEAFSLALARCLPQTETHTALAALLTVLTTNTVKTEPAHIPLQATRHASHPTIASAQSTATRLANTGTSTATALPSSRHPQIWKHSLVLVLLLASSVAAAGLLIVLGVPYAPSGGGFSPRPPDAVVSSATRPWPVAPQSGDTRATPLQSESSDASGPPGAAALPSLMGTTGERTRPEGVQNPQKQSHNVSAPQPSRAKAPESVARPLRASRKGSESPSAARVALSSHDAPAPPATKEGTKGAEGWYIRK